MDKELVFIDENVKTIFQNIQPSQILKILKDLSLTIIHPKIP